MLSLKLKSRLAPPTLLLILPVTFLSIVLSSEQLEGGLSVPDSCEDDDEADPVLWDAVFPSPGSLMFDGVKELCTFLLDSALPSGGIALPLPLLLCAAPFVMLRWLLPLLRLPVTLPLLLQMLLLEATAVATFFKTA